MKNMTVIAEPHRTICENPIKNEENELKLLGNAFKEMMKNELLNAMMPKTTSTVYEPLETHK